MKEFLQYSIRQGHPTDLPYIYDICLKTGFNGKDTSDLISDPFMIGQYFAAPYLFFEIDTCFVVEKGGIPFGYVLGASSTEKYYQWLNNYWLSVVRKRYPVTLKPKSDFEKFLIDIINQDAILEDFLCEYPSHLHIDLLPEIQQKGFGKKLITIFIERLQEKGSTGLHLGVNVDNINAFKFYKKIGFKELKNISKTIFMGMKF